MRCRAESSHRPLIMMPCLLNFSAVHDLTVLAPHYPSEQYNTSKTAMALNRLPLFPLFKSIRAVCILILSHYPKNPSPPPMPSSSPSKSPALSPKSPNTMSARDPPPEPPPMAAYEVLAPQWWDKRD